MAIFINSTNIYLSLASSYDVPCTMLSTGRKEMENVDPPCSRETHKSQL